jgi:uncharacterized protein (TIGR00251 family)
MTTAPLPPYLAPDPAAESGSASCLLDIKAVPGARRDEIAGPLGDRLKVRTSSPPEDGRANKAICTLIAQTLGLRPAAVTLVRGQTSAQKTLRIVGLTAADAALRIAAQ